VYQDQLTCWAWGNPGYCGPNAIVRPGDNINFSFGQTNLYQAQAIASVLPNSGTGLRVNGYNYGFTAKNGNGWDNGGLDYLMAYVAFNGSDGKQVFYKDYNLNSTFNWTTFNWSETFNTPFASKDLSTVQYGIVGRDNNFWAGPYGPEVYNVNFSLKYSVDPCATNTLYSPTCPGYLEALAKLTPKVEPTSTTVAPTTISVTPTTATVEPTVISTTPTIQPSVATATVASSTPSATNPQPKAGEITTSGSKPTVSMSTIMNILSTESTRVSSVEKTVVQQAVSEAQKAGEQATQQGETIAASLTSQSISASMTQTPQTSTTKINNQTSSTIALVQLNQQSVNNGIGLRAPAPMMLDTNSTQSIQYSSITDVRNLVLDNRSQVQPTTTNSVNYSIVAPTITDPYKKYEMQSTEIEIPKTDTFKMGTRSTLNDYLNDKPYMSLMGVEQQQDGSVKRNVQPNEVAGSVDINTIATQPKGYEVYSLVSLPDTSFYKTDAIYKNQNTVDNVRVLRGLTSGSDKLHQEMVNQQYKGN
jgi:hypothetical protein